MASEKEYQKRLEFYQRLRKENPVLDEEGLALNKDGLETRAKVSVAQNPVSITGTGAIFQGFHTGASISVPVIGWDAGYIRGKEHGEKHYFGFKTKNKIRIWAGTDNIDDFLDSMIEIASAYDSGELIEIGGILIKKKNLITEFKMEYLFIQGPNSSFEERILLE